MQNRILTVRFWNPGSGVIDAADPGQPSLHGHIGEVYLKMKRWDDAARAFAKAIELDSDCARAYHGLAVSLVAQERFSEAADRALTAIGLQYHLPLAHYHLGVARARSGDRARGRQAFETCLRLAPGNDLAQRWLRQILEEELIASYLLIPALSPCTFVLDFVMNQS